MHLQWEFFFDGGGRKGGDVLQSSMKYGCIQGGGMSTGDQEFRVCIEGGGFNRDCSSYSGRQEQNEKKEGLS